MRIEIPKDKYSSEEREEINVKYNDYLKELHNQELINKFVNSRVKYNDNFLKFQNICLFIISFSVVNILIALINLTLFKENDWYLVFIVCICPPFIFAPIAIFNWIDSFLRKLFCNIITHQEEEKNNLTRLYEKNVFEKYEKIIKLYEEITEYDNMVKKIKSDYKRSIMSRLFSLDDKLFEETLIMILSDKYKVGKSKIKNCLICVNGNDRFLLMYKKIKRSISISDVKRFEECITKGNYEYGTLYYIGDISTKAVRYCSKKKIYLYNHYDICNEIYDYKMRHAKKEKK